MKKVLVIAYHFYPDQEIGAVRSVKFAKYLPEFGWQPVILTVKRKYYSKTDKSPLGFQCEIHETGKLPVLDDIYLGIKNLLRKNNRNNSSEEEKTAGQNETIDPFLVEGVPFWKRFIFSLSTTPDENIGWLLPGAIKAVGLVRRQNIDAVYSSGSPWTCHLIGLITKYLTRKPWLADFRDPWIPLQKPRQLITGISEKFETWMEKKVVLRADRVLTATDEHREEMRDRYSPYLDEKIITILNGFDDADYSAQKKPGKTNRDYIEFLSAGNLYFGRDPSGFIEALGKMTSENTIDKIKIKVRFYGRYDINLAKISEIIEKYQLGETIEFNAPVSKSRYLELINDTDILLLLQSSLASNQIPGKTFEYLATGNPIIALVSDGATANLLGSFGRAMIARPDDIHSIRNSINAAMELNNNNAAIVDDSMLDKFTRRNLAGNLAKVLEIVSQKY